MFWHIYDILYVSPFLACNSKVIVRSSTSTIIVVRSRTWSVLNKLFTSFYVMTQTNVIKCWPFYQCFFRLILAWSGKFFCNFFLLIPKCKLFSFRLAKCWEPSFSCINIRIVICFRVIIYIWMVNFNTVLDITSPSIRIISILESCRFSSNVRSIRPEGTLWLITRRWWVL